MEAASDAPRAPVREVRVLPDLDQLTSAARAELVERGRRAIAERGVFRLCLSGGSTPKRLYASLEERDLDWPRVEIFFGDERHVPPDHKDSNYRMAREALFERVPLPAQNIHRIEAELPAPEAAARYEAVLSASFALRTGELPRFDLALMGMGTDGHTASLFPGSSLLEERRRLVASAAIEELDTERITLTVPVFEAAACLLFLVAGGDKASALARILAAEPGTGDLPAGRIVPRAGELVWMVDHAAAGR
jgi:6-phosphogluconolactonase